MQDQQIVELIRHRKEDKAMVKLYHYFPKVEKLILSKGGTKQDALDIYQEALIIFCRKAREQSFELTAAIGTYLYSVCRYLWKDELKQKNRSQEIDPDLPADTDIQEAIEKEQQFKLAEQAILQLGKRCREVLELFYLDNLKMKVIAGKMGFSSEKIAKNQKYKCLERAKQQLKKLQQEVVND